MGTENLNPQLPPEIKPPSNFSKFAVISGVVLVAIAAGATLYFISKKPAGTQNPVVNKQKQTSEKSTIENINVEQTFLVRDKDGNIYEANIDGKKTKITTLPFTPPLEVLDNFISKNRDISLWVHRRIVQGKAGFDEAGPREAYIYNRSINTWREFKALKPSRNIFEIEPLKLSPDGNTLIVLEKFNSGQISLLEIDLKTEAKQTLIENYQRKQDITGGIDKELTFWRWLGDSTNFYYTQRENTLVERKTSDWQSHSVLYKFNISSKQADFVFDGNSICKDSSIIPSAQNQNIVIVICATDSGGNVKTYVYNIVSKKSDIVFEGHYGLEIADININSVTPDGEKFVYFFLPEKVIYVYNIATGGRKSIDLNNNFNTTHYFSPDSSTIVYQGQNVPGPKSGIFSYNFATGQIKQILANENMSIIGF